MGLTKQNKTQLLRKTSPFALLVGHHDVTTGCENNFTLIHEQNKIPPCEHPTEFYGHWIVPPEKQGNVTTLETPLCRSRSLSLSLSLLLACLLACLLAQRLSPGGRPPEPCALALRFSPSLVSVIQEAQLLCGMARSHALPMQLTRTPPPPGPIRMC